MRHPHADQLNPTVVTTVERETLTADELTAVVRRAQQGDAQAQTALISAYSRRIRGFVHVFVRQPSALEDLVQMAFIKMIRSLPRLRDPRVFESWLFRLARTNALDFLRRQRCRPVTVADERTFLNAPDERRNDMITEIYEALERALEQLGAKDRDVMRMIIQGHDYRTIAARTGITVGAVKARVHRARTFLRATVGRDTGLRPDSQEPIADAA